MMKYALFLRKVDFGVVSPTIKTDIDIFEPSIFIVVWLPLWLEKLPNFYWKLEIHAFFGMY